MVQSPIPRAAAVDPAAHVVSMVATKADLVVATTVAAAVAVATLAAVVAVVTAVAAKVAVDSVAVVIAVAFEVPATAEPAANIARWSSSFFWLQWYQLTLWGRGLPLLLVEQPMFLLQPCQRWL